MKYFVSLLAVILAVNTFAEDAGDTKEERAISAEAELGMIITSGNTESSATNAKLDVKQDFTKWKNNYVLEAFYKDDELTIDDGAGDVTRITQTTADKIFASFQSDYKLGSKHQGIFGYASYENDKFSGFDYQSTIAVGYSDRLYENAKSWLDYSVGPGMAIARTEETVDDEGIVTPSEKTETFAVRLSGAFQYKISSHAKFIQKLSSDLATESDKNTRVKSETSLTATINGSMALKLSYLINHNTQPPSEKEKTDTTTAVTLVFTY